MSKIPFQSSAILQSKKVKGFEKHQAVTIIYLFILLINFQISHAQSYNFSGRWECLGPLDKPESPNDINACGIGPVEFIRVFQPDSKYILAGSISGGLFFSEDRGENWINSGSDDWNYSGCGWADFHPSDHQTWFAWSNFSDNNGKPGKMGKHGGVLRTRNSGTSWEYITSASMANTGSENMDVFGFRFLPADPSVMFLLSDEGLFITPNCLADNVVWKKINTAQGYVYDLDFVNSQIWITLEKDKKWKLIQYDYLTEKIVVVDAINIQGDEKRSITIEPVENDLLVLIDYAKLSNDQLYRYFIDEDSLALISTSQQVNFGHGHTFAVNPHDQNEVMVGHSVHIKKYNLKTGKGIKTGSGYHVDIEFVCFDPLDSNRIYLACHGGVYVSDDKGTIWNSRSNGLAVAEVMGLDVSESDPNELVIGTFHDGSSVLADFYKNGNYLWRNVNGGDALTPLIHPENAAIVYTSTQYSGGGLYHSADTASNLLNMHTANGLGTPGWELTAAMHPVDFNTLFFNYTRKDNDSKGNIDVARTSQPSQKKSAEPISDFKKTHQLNSYKVYGLFNNAFYPDHLYAYVLHYDQDENGNKITRHRLYRTTRVMDSASAVIQSWYELNLPVNAWLGDVECHPQDPDCLFVSYVNSESDGQLVYCIKYNKKQHWIKKITDVSQNIPPTVAGRFNMTTRINDEGKPELFIATRSGVFYANEKSMKGKENWLKIGEGLPHCKIYGLHFHEKTKQLTVGLFGRGVWRYQL